MRCSNKETTPRRRRPLVVSLVLVLGLAATACGASPGADERAVAALPAADADADGTEDTDGDATNSDSDEDKPALTPEEAELAFSRCLADNGIEDPFSSSGGESIDGDESGPTGAFTVESDGEFEAFEAALEECNGILEDAFGEFELSPEQEAAQKDAQAAFDRCMAEQGFELAGSGTITVDEADVETIDAAFETCSEAFEDLDGPFAQDQDPSTEADE